MKKILVVILVSVFVMMLQSCGTTYEYIQILSTKPVNNVEKTTLTNGGVLYEDENCAVFYKFWTQGGDAGFEFYNKTDEIIYLDLTKTFFIKNGVAYDYYTDKTVTDTKTSQTSSTIAYGYAHSASSTYSASISQYYAGNFGQMPITTYSPMASGVSIGASKSFVGSLFKTNSTTTTMGRSTSVSITEQPILAIPPKSSKFVQNYSIISNEYVSCDLKYYPESRDNLTFDSSNSPVTFSNYITYTKGDKSEEISLENQFYVSEITNYAKQDVTTYVKRETPCENILTPAAISRQKTAPLIYDAYINAGDASSFYMPYRVFSKRRLYEKRSTGMYWDSFYNGYTSSTGWTSPSYVKKYVDPSIDTLNVATQDFRTRLKMLGWQNSVLGIAYDNALIQLTMIADEALANEYRATINILLENVFENRISKDSIEKKIAAAKNKSQKEEYCILLDIAKEF